MEIYNKDVELQIDEKPNGGVIRVNVGYRCLVRICRIPKELMRHRTKTGDLSLIDICVEK